MATPELSASGMMSLSRLQMAPLSPVSNSQPLGSCCATMEANHTDMTLPGDRSKPRSHRQKYSGTKVTKSEVEHIQEFERLWARFVEQAADSGDLPKGKREIKIEKLQNEIRAIKDEREPAEGELRKRLAFIRESTESLQYIYEAKMKGAAQEQQEKSTKLKQRVKNISEASSIRDETFPWLHFLRQLDLKARKPEHENPCEGDGGGSTDQQSQQRQHPTAIRPSERALYLTSQVEGIQSSSDKELCAYRIDHALLSTHVSMLHREITRYEKSIEAQETAGQFLTQYDVWRLLSSRPTSGAWKEQKEQEPEQQADDKNIHQEKTKAAAEEEREEERRQGEEEEERGREAEEGNGEEEAKEEACDEKPKTRYHCLSTRLRNMEP